MQQIISHSEDETREIGKKIAQQLNKGDILCLKGDLGAGKTLLSKSIAHAFGVKEPVTSPTFTIVHQYEGRFPLYHFDVYRIHDIDEMYEIGIEEYLYGDGVCLIEWADKIQEILPEESIWIELSRGEGDNDRILNIRGELIMNN
ncbi:MAG: tRNA (adenosine(37)-N6)-threonylcarbamoyltransferase complex ATPase subunit type 1 TsaE [Clostridia bacterium]|nr:tRNA (adenosine(37)-N6)-threonylcarbamoyltransferase complex ATPase subunit type 1 TsaE [Clostridia bacterium]